MKTALHLVLPDQTLVIDAEAGDLNRPLSRILHQRGFSLNTRCGEKGLCRGCQCSLVDGAVQLPEKTVSSSGEPLPFLSCQARILPNQETVVRVPQKSLLYHHPVVTGEFKIKVSVGRQPLFPIASGRPSIAAAADIGTTTVFVILLNPETGKVLAQAGDFNAQIRYGDNVLTRIDACSRDPTNLNALQQTLLENTLLPLLRQCCRQIQRDPKDLSGIAVTGNTTMLHLLAGVDPSPLGIVPFRPAFLKSQSLRYADLPFPDSSFAPDLPLYLLPGISGYVGADICAGLFATGTPYAEEAVLFLDVGTNGEIALHRGSDLWVTATAAGPAFEGSGLTSGCRAGEGAVSHLSFESNPFRVELEILGKGRHAHGICGTAYLDFLARARAINLLTPTGRFDPAFRENHPEWFSREDDGWCFNLTPGKNQPVSISEVDVALLLQAKAAIAAGIQVLLQLAGLRPNQVDTLYLAGGFGLHLNRESAIRSGLLPGFHLNQIEPVGNTSLAGAYLACLDQSILAEINRFRERARIIELNTQPQFEDTYIENLLLEV